MYCSQECFEQYEHLVSEMINAKSLEKISLVITGFWKGKICWLAPKGAGTAKRHRLQYGKQLMCFTEHILLLMMGERPDR
jgi:hypothetical protein